MNDSDGIEVTRAEINDSPYLNSDRVYYTYFGGIKRVHRSGTRISIVKVELIKNNSGRDSILVSDKNKTLELEIVPNEILINQLDGKMMTFFYAEIDFRGNNRHLVLINEVVPENLWF